MHFIIKLYFLIYINGFINCFKKITNISNFNNLNSIKENFILKTTNFKLNKYNIKKKYKFLCKNHEEKFDQNDEKKQKNIKFYDFSHIYKNYYKNKNISKEKTINYNTDNKNKENGYKDMKFKNEQNVTKNDIEEKKNEYEIINNIEVKLHQNKLLEKELNEKTNNDITDKKINTLLVKDDSNRIQKLNFENIYDYSEIFKEKEKKIEIKTYVGNVFQKFPKFKDNLKVIKDALLYLKFIEKGNLYLIKNVDKKTMNSEPYDDISNHKKNKGTKKDKIKLELTSIYNNINKEKHMKKRICKECCIKIDLYTKLLSRPLNNIYNLHKNLKKFLHPFQLSSYENTITNLYKDGDIAYSLNDVLNNIIEIRKLITVTGKTYAGQLKYLRRCREIFNTLNEAIVDINIILQSGRKWLDIYNSYVKNIRKIKYIDITKPAIAIIGCTNVGKSSILKSITNANPKIADYNFTTKEFNLGHYSFNHENDIITTQIMDLPGLINREENRRNLMEKLTISALKNLPSAVIYVFDPSKKEDHKYSSLQSQINIRYYLRGIFPFRPWIDVITKSDLINNDNILLPNDIKENALFISSENENSLLPLKNKIHQITYSLINYLEEHTME